MATYEAKLAAAKAEYEAAEAAHGESLFGSLEVNEEQLAATCERLMAAESAYRFLADLPARKRNILSKLENQGGYTPLQIEQLIESLAEIDAAIARLTREPARSRLSSLFYCSKK